VQERRRGTAAQLIGTAAWPAPVRRSEQLRNVGAFVRCAGILQSDNPLGLPSSSYDHGPALVERLQAGADLGGANRPLIWPCSNDIQRRWADGVHSRRQQPHTAVRKDQPANEAAARPAASPQ